MLIFRQRHFLEKVTFHDHFNHEQTAFRKPIVKKNTAIVFLFCVLWQTFFLPVIVTFASTTATTNFLVQKNVSMYVGSEKFVFVFVKNVHDLPLEGKRHVIL